MSTEDKKIWDAYQAGWNQQPWIEKGRLRPRLYAVGILTAAYTMGRLNYAMELDDDKCSSEIIKEIKALENESDAAASVSSYHISAGGQISQVGSSR